jgi:2-phosphoglycerate kinase
MFRTFFLLKNVYNLKAGVDPNFSTFILNISLEDGRNNIRIAVHIFPKFRGRANFRNVVFVNYVSFSLENQLGKRRVYQRTHRICLTDLWVN